MIMNLGNKRERRAGGDSTGLQQCPQTSHKGCVTAPDTNFPLTYLLLLASGKLVKWSPLTFLYRGGNQGLEILCTPPKPVQLSRKQTCKSKHVIAWLRGSQCHRTACTLHPCAAGMLACGSDENLFIFSCGVA